MTSIQGQRLNEMLQQSKSGGVNNTEFKKLVDEAKKDGKIDVDEANVIINAAFADGHISSDDEKNAMLEIGKNLNSQEYKQLTDISQRVKDAKQNPVEGNISFLIEQGMKAKLAGSNMTQATLQQQQSEEGFFRSASRVIGNLPVVGDSWNSLQGNDKDGNTQGQVKQAQQAGNALAGRVAQNAKATFSTQTESDRGDCVFKSLKQIQPKGENWDLSSIKGGVTVSTDKLKQLTGHTWGQVDISKLQQNMAGRTLIVDGGHSFKLDSIDQKNKILNVTTPSGQKTTLPMNNPALRAFVMGEAQTGTTASRADRVTHNYNELRNDSARAINAYDKTNGQTNSGWETRKLLIFMSDPKMSAKFDSFKALAAKVVNTGADNPSMEAMTKFLKEIGIDTNKFGRDQIMSMCQSMLKDIPGGFKIPNSNPPKTVKNMMEAFDWLNNGSKGQLTGNQTNVMSGLEYSNVDLRNYFTLNRGIDAKVEDMKDNFERLIKCKDGC